MKQYLDNIYIMDIICIGEALIDFFAVQPAAGMQEVSEFRRVAGGAPANVAVGCARLGKMAAFIGRVGDDHFGRYLAGVLSENNVNIDLLQYDRKARTGLAFIALPSTTTREFLFYRNPSADMRIDSRHFDRDFIKDTKIFHYGSITLINEPSAKSTIDAVKIAKNSGALISYDPNLRINLWPNEKTARERIIDGIVLSDIVKINDEELKFITGADDCLKGIEKILGFGPSLCVVTCGSEGALFGTKNIQGKVPIFNVDTVDTTGCGDSFVAGLLSSLAGKEYKKIIKDYNSLEKIVVYATAAASLTSMKKGVIPSLPYADRVEQFLSKRLVK